MEESVDSIAKFFSSPRTSGFIGGLVLNIYNLIESTKLPDVEEPSLDTFYWLTFFFWPLLGLLFVHVYLLSGMDIDGLIALQVGLTSPLILKGLISSQPPSTISTSRDA
ncbi:MAG: hypothetical protein GDA42_11455 [Ekhidna sp.]|nr:hypothetical protein [Ekhidna sp.]MBC6411048.1 hypothetical protein [Ekhidna sp.]